MCNGHRGTRSRPSLLYSPGAESKGSNEILRGEGDISRTIQASVLPRSGCPPTIEKGSGVGEGRNLTAEEVELDDLRRGRIPSWRMTCLACAGQK